jgi:WD40 repeat protein
MSTQRLATMLLWTAAISPLLVACSFRASAAPPPENAKSHETKSKAVDAVSVKALIAKLGDDSYEQRESAQKQLATLGEPAMEFLDQAARENPDAEVRERADQLLLAIERQLFPVVLSLRGYDRRATRIAVTPDGTRFVTVGENALCQGVLKPGTSIMKFGPDHPCWSLALSVDGKRAIAGFHDHIARVYDLETGKQVQELTGHQGEIWGAALLPDGKRAITGAKDKSLRLWDLRTGKQLALFAGVKEDVRCLALSPDSLTVAVGHWPGRRVMGTIRLWDVEKQKEIRELAGHTHEVTCVAFSPDGKRLVSGSFDKTARVWDIASGRELRRFVCGSNLECAAFADGGRRVLCGGEQVLQLWDVERGNRILRCPHVLGTMMGLAPLPGRSQVVTAGRDGRIRLWQWNK